MTTPATDNRRAQLRRWIDAHFNGLQVAFVSSTFDGEKQVSQGEISALLKNKSFGEKRARSLEKQARMPVGYLDSQVDPASKTMSILQQSVLFARDEKVSPITSPLAGVSWPFKQVSYRRFTALREILGHKGFAEAVSDMDAHLDILVTKWEKEAASKASKKIKR